MSNWKSIKARRLLAALLRIGWRVKRQTGSHKILERPNWSDTVFAFHDNEKCWTGGEGDRIKTRRL